MEHATSPALFIGNSCLDITLPVKRLPTRDEKIVATESACGIGGGALTAAVACATLGITPSILTTIGKDDLGPIIRRRIEHYGIIVYPRRVAETSVSVFMPNNQHRAMVGMRDTNFLDGFPEIELAGCKVLHLDGHQPDAAYEYARRCRERGILTSLDGGTVRKNTEELLGLIDVAVISQKMCEEMDYFDKPWSMLRYLKGRGCRIGAVTLGERGLVWYDEKGNEHRMPALPVPSIKDTTGAGDIFHGAYVFSYLRWPRKSWEEHFLFARAAAAHSIQCLGNEASCPALQDVESILQNGFAGQLMAAK